MARRIAADALARHRDAGNPMVSRPDPSTVRAMLEFMAGMPIEDDYVELMTEELAIAGADHRAPDWTVSDFGDVAFRVAIVGAGMSGIAAA